MPPGAAPTGWSGGKWRTGLRGPSAVGSVGAQGQGEKGGRGERRGCSGGSGNGAGSQPLRPPGELGCGASHVHPGVLRAAAAGGRWGRPSVGRASRWYNHSSAAGAPGACLLRIETIDVPGGADVSKPGQGLHTERRRRLVLQRIATPRAQKIQSEALTEEAS
uniref:Uncharacterized protein n=1 Tax=Mustela putorius furo TaxID=9669 RepID=M3YZX9_MUSPF